MKNGVFWDVKPCGSVRTDVSEEHVYMKMEAKISS
jgi:hypothetical protein